MNWRDAQERAWRRVGFIDSPAVQGVILRAVRRAESFRNGGWMRWVSHAKHFADASMREFRRSLREGNERRINREMHRCGTAFALRNFYSHYFYMANKRPNSRAEGEQEIADILHSSAEEFYSIARMTNGWDGTFADLPVAVAAGVFLESDTNERNRLLSTIENMDTLILFLGVVDSLD